MRPFPLPLPPDCPGKSLLRYSIGVCDVGHGVCDVAHADAVSAKWLSGGGSGGVGRRGAGRL